MTCRLAAILPLFLINAPALGQLSPPTILTSRPLSLSPGEATTLEVKGPELDGATELGFEGAGVRVENLETGKTSIKAKVTVPADAPPGPLVFRVVGPKGVSNAGR
ncbi:MAG: hypothetical protein LC745_05190, partial [Planctomycetia bacterium]|nr:hypothetical protein [Planctomycetia bacterium]